MLRLFFNSIYFLLILLPRQSESPSPRIVGGLPTSIKKFPHQVFVKILLNGVRQHTWCGGTLYKENIVISAAHCFKYPSLVIVYPGITFNNDTTRGGYQVLKILKHEKFKRKRLAYDIALLFLDKKVELNSRVNLLPISSLEENDLVGKEAAVVGWGSMWEKGPTSVILRYAYVTVVSSEECRWTFPRRVNEATICAKAPYGGQDACQGDSGGPLIYNNELIGIVSMGYGCGRVNVPAIYTKISAVKKWIEEKSELQSGEEMDSGRMIVL